MFYKFLVAGTVISGALSIITAITAATACFDINNAVTPIPLIASTLLLTIISMASGGIFLFGTALIDVFDQEAKQKKLEARIKALENEKVNITIRIE